MAARRPSQAAASAVASAGRRDDDLAAGVLEQLRDVLRAAPVGARGCGGDDDPVVALVGERLAQRGAPEYADDTAVLRTHVANLRRKIGADVIRTDPGVGYRFTET